MAIEIEEKFEVDAPIDQVWKFVTDPHKVAACMPGAKLEEAIDEKNFLGSIRVKVGAITTGYKGKVQFTDVDESKYSIAMVAEGTETGGGTAKGTMTSFLREVEGGGTEVVANANVDLTGRIMQVGRGMIKGVSHQLFLQFVRKAKKELEAEGTASAAGSATDSASGAVDAASSSPAPAEEGDSIAVLPLLLRTIWEAIVNFFRRLFGR